MVLSQHNGKRRRHVLLVVGVGLFMLSVGMVAGFFIAKSMGTYMLTHCKPPLESQPSAADSCRAVAPGNFRPGAARAMASRFKELPEPGSAAALLAAPTDDVTQQLYTWYDDALLITEELTAAFLRRLETYLAGDHTMPLAMSSSELSAVISTFMRLSKDVLNYLRHHHSDALLPMLRQFSKQGSISITDVNPDSLQQEVNNLLNLTALGHWYSHVAKQDTNDLQTRPFTSTEGGSSTQSTAELLVGDTAAGGGRHLLSGHRRLQASQSIPPIPLKQALREDAIPTTGPVLSLEDMLCTIKSYSPTGLDGMWLPISTNGTDEEDVAVANKTAAARQPIKCKPQPQLGVFQHGNVVFRPIVLPVVFHCQRFLQGDTVLPPMWDPETGAQHLIDEANKHYRRTGIQFKVQEVRYDVEKYPYLLLASLDDWQSCTGNPTQEASGFPCLQETARFPEVASLAQEFVINVLVGGSQTTMFCNDTLPADSVCNTLYYGYTGSIGPWYTKSSSTWREGKADENWITITWDMFSTSVANSKRFWDSGAVTLAHELGHYLGLMHTHEGAAPCEGDGFGKADAVPDTPTNLQTVQWAASKQLAVALARWCSDFRTGKKPQPSELLLFKSCPNKQGGLQHPVDNLFNLESYLPDPCCMMLSPNQVARLQWASATFRPKMMSAFYV